MGDLRGGKFWRVMRHTRCVGRTRSTEDAAGVRNWAAKRVSSRPARASVTRNSHQRCDEFERGATGTGGQFVVADAISEFNDEVVIRCENPHRLYEFLFIVHFHANKYGEGGRTTAVLP
jgi:hypothetical protein